jgi:regulator of protease activity HflC (stomatin/prohibitin superfamily)
MDSQIRFLILLLAGLFFCLALYFLTGLVHVKEGTLVVLSKKGKILKTLAKGTYYYLPLLYQVSEPLPIQYVSKRLRLDGKHVLTFSYAVVDPEKYVASQLKIKGVLQDIFSESLQNPRLFDEFAQVLTNLGISAKEFRLIER